jgi:transposase
MKSTKTSMLGPAGLELERLLIEPHGVSLFVSSTATSGAKCPVCGHRSSQVHSRYTRTVADLPWHGVPVTLHVRVRRFFCNNSCCERAIFAERLEEVAAYARKTDRLQEALLLIGFSLGGRAGARVAKELGLLASRDTLLRRVRSVPLPDSGEVRVLGVDDWARRKGQTYATILVDLEHRKPVDLLPDREASSLANWLRAHPEVELISRDRAGAYADGACEGAPQAVQIADRWHLLKNMSEVVERFMDRHHHLVRQAAKDVAEAQLIGHWLAESSEAMLSSRDEGEKRARRQKRYARYLEVMELHSQGVSERGIARALSINRATVRKFIHADGFPERAPKKSSGSILDPYIPYIHKRWAEGSQNAVQLWREIKERGYSGKAAMVRRYVTRLRTRLARLTLEQRTQFLGAKTTFKAPTSRRAAWWLLKQREDLPPERQTFVEQLCQLCPEAKEVKKMAGEFRELVRERQPEAFDRWLEAAKGSEAAELKGFAEGLIQDREAVRAALTHEWSSGQTEGQINRLKFIKRQMYGRANFELLKARFLHAA